MHKLTSTTSILFGFACWHLSACAAEPEPPTFTAIYSSEAVKIDGKLEDACWLEAEAYPLLLPKDRNSGNATPIEIGTVRLAWDEQFFYAAFEFTDSDVVAEVKPINYSNINSATLPKFFLSLNRNHTIGSSM